jgi:O-antigen ligase
LTWLSGLNFSISSVTVRYDLFATILIAFIEFKTPKHPKNTGPAVGKFRSQSYHWMIYWLLFSISTTIILSTAKLVGLWNLIQYSLGVLSLILISKSHRKFEYVQALSRVSFLFGLIYVLTIAISFFGLNFGIVSRYFYSDNGSFQGLSIERNILASQALIMLAVNLYFRKQLNKFGWFTNILLLIIIVIGQTRATWIAFACIILIYSFGVRSLVSRVILALTTALLVAFYLSQSYRATFSNDQFANLLNKNSGTGEYRLSIYSRAWSEVLSDWRRTLFGFGFGTYGEMHPIDRTGVQSEYLSSIWVNVLHSTGIIGLYLFIRSLVSIVKQAALRTEAAAIVLALAICASTTSPFLLQFPWIALGIVFRKVNEKSWS